MAWERKGTVDFFTAEAGRRQLIDWLFIETMRDLTERAQAPNSFASRYTVLGIAPLLRKLLLDSGRSLVYQVRKAGPDRPEPMFRSSQYPRPDTRGDLVAIGTASDRLWDPSAPPVNLDEFLKYRVGIVGDHDLTAREAIRHYAHVEGGVHLGKDEIPANDLLQLTGPASPILQMTPFLVLSRIAEVVIDACSPLLTAAEAEFARRNTNPRPDEIENPAARLGLSRPEPVDEV